MFELFGVATLPSFSLLTGTIIAANKNKITQFLQHKLALIKSNLQIVANLEGQGQYLNGARLALGLASFLFIGQNTPGEKR